MEPAGLKALFELYLGLSPHEGVALLFDKDREEVREIIEAGLKSRNQNYTTVALEQKNGFYTDRAIDILEDPDYPVILMTSVKSLWHHPARKRAKHQLGKRIASVICGARGFDNPFSCAEPDRMEEIGKPLSEYLMPGAKVRVTTPAGTDVEAIVENPFLETGIFYLPGTGGNWPCGEAGFGPREGSVNGTIVYDLKFKHLGSMQTEKAIVRVEDDECVKFEGDGGSKLKKLFQKRDSALFYVGEVAFGINYAFEKNDRGIVTIDPDPRTIVEEKAAGTAHFGHGGNLSFGKRTGDHADGVVSLPTIVIDGITIMENGKFRADALPPGTGKWLGDLLSF